MWNTLSGVELTLQQKQIFKSVKFSNDLYNLATAWSQGDCTRHYTLHDIIAHFTMTLQVLQIVNLDRPSEPIVKFDGHTSDIKQVC